MSEEFRSKSFSSATGRISSLLVVIGEYALMMNSNYCFYQGFETEVSSDRLKLFIFFHSLYLHCTQPILSLIPFPWYGIALTSDIL